MSIDWSGDFDAFDAAIEWAELTSAQAVEIAAQDAQARMRQKIAGGPKTGRITTSKTKPSPHQTSAPGEAPAHWTGGLEDAVRATPEAPAAWIVDLDESTTDEGVPYKEVGALLELGSAGGKVAPRPYFVSSVEEAEEVLSTALTRLFSGD